MQLYTKTAMNRKAIVLVLVGLMLSGLVSAQQVRLSESVSFVLPKNSKQLSYGQKSVYARKHDIQIVGMPNDSSKSYFALKEVIISLSVGMQEKKVDLVSFKKSLEEMARGITGNKIDFVTVNGQEFLTSQSPHAAKIWIYGADQTGLNMIFGVLEFNEQNRKNADSLLAEVLGGFKFQPDRL